jgi:hypothetical protein
MNTCRETTMQTVKTDAIIKVPPEVAICPICGAEVAIEEIDEWEQEDDGTWSAGEHGVKIECSTAPDIESDNWDDFFAEHWSMPYVDWLQIEVKVYNWLHQNYRFDLEHAC